MKRALIKFLGLHGQAHRRAAEAYLNLYAMWRMS